MKIDICNVCHPFYTGKLKYVDTAGRIEKFQKKFATTGYASLQRGKKKPAEASGRTGRSIAFSDRPSQLAARPRDRSDLCALGALLDAPYASGS